MFTYIKTYSYVYSSPTSGTFLLQVAEKSHDLQFLFERGRAERLRAPHTELGIYYPCN